jgi:hypothetical protein
MKVNYLPLGGTELIVSESPRNITIYFDKTGELMCALENETLYVRASDASNKEFLTMLSFRYQPKEIKAEANLNKLFTICA